MAVINGNGASPRVIRSAVQHIEDTGDSTEWVRQTILSNPQEFSLYADRQHLKMDGGGLMNIAAMPRPTRLALEMALHEEQERRALHGELEMLKSAWRHAEEVAAIEDALLLPDDIDARLEAMRGARTWEN